MGEDPSAAEVILELCSAAGPGGSCSPEDAAKALARRAEDGRDWRSQLSRVREGAIALALDGRIAIFRKGKPVDPRAFKGGYRLGLPR